jgi:1,2-diacylglycerol 3-alpha-glucosyltransferase
MPRIAVLFDSCGPYHIARLRAASQISKIYAVQYSSKSHEYEWNSGDGHELCELITLLDHNEGAARPKEKLQRRVREELARISPEVVAVPGWSDSTCLGAVKWACENSMPVVVMSESTPFDYPRKWWKEWFKRRYLQLAAAALGGGSPQRQYLRDLGISDDVISTGYASIDNQYFETHARTVRADAEAQRRALKLSQQYFLAINRFIRKKNLPRLLHAYEEYRSNLRDDAWDLVLLGDGELRAPLEQLCKDLGIADHVHMPGFKQYADLPAYYALAEAFIHSSTSEQWGLVVNEAMASGLPVLVSNKCGCVADLVHDDINGWRFDPSDSSAIADAMIRFHHLGVAKRAAMAAASQRLVDNFSPQRFATGLKLAAERAVQAGPKKLGLLNRAVLNFLIWRTK